MLYATGDCHGGEDDVFGVVGENEEGRPVYGHIPGGVHRFSAKLFPQRRELSREDYLMITGDFGLLFTGGKSERKWLDWLEECPFSTVWVDGNHENFDMLGQYPEKEWNGGMAREIRPHIHHLCRGYVFELDGKTVFAFGGAQSHDFRQLLTQGEGWKEESRRLRNLKIPFRTEGLDWWPEEMPCQEEYDRARASLERAGWKVDVVLTHCAPTSIQKQLFPGYEANELTDFLEEIMEKLQYGQWYCGHYHQNCALPQKRFQVLYQKIVPVSE